MTKAETHLRLQEWAAMHDRLDQEWDRMSGALGVGMAETPLWQASWKMFEKYTKTLGDLVGDPRGEWLDWFCYENDMGGKGMKARYDDVRPIETLEDLVGLIIEGRTRQ
jgi:hypothetical protein